MQNTDKSTNKPAKIPKKRGRKPKGGKIISKLPTHIQEPKIKQNIILHLKCHTNELNKNKFLDNINYTPKIENVESFDILKTNTKFKTNDLNYDILNNTEPAEPIKDNIDNTPTHETTENKLIWDKLKQLEANLNTNNISDEKSACFWCTYNFDNPANYIPKYQIDESYYVYGCFCSPECAVSYLMNENLDSSTKFERLHLLNNIYAKIYNYTDNIKPAPNPYYLLDKYYGNLTINEYRKLLKNDQLLLVVDKPLTRTLPELYEDNTDTLNNTITNTSINCGFQLKCKHKINKQSSVTNPFNINT
jgi:hypothetical protein